MNAAQASSSSIVAGSATPRWPAFALAETIISLGLIIALGTVVYALATPSMEAANVRTEVAHLNALVDAVNGTFASDVDFAGLDQRQVDVSGFPTTLSAFGQPFTVLPAAMKQPADTWQAVYTSAPSGICARLVSAELASGRWEAVLVGGTVVASAASAPAACIDPKTQDSTGEHEVRFVRAYTGARRVSSGLPPICWDHSREQVIANGPPVDCPTDPAAYNSASR